MHPPWSMILFTTLAGTAQGLLLALVGLDFTRASVPTLLFESGALIVLALGVAGLVAATFHLGHPLRAWRAVAMWRTSWLSREVIVLPLFLLLVAAWGVAHWWHAPTRWLGFAAAALALLLYLCTGMIYAAVKAIAAWAHPITLWSFGLTGLASGALLATTLAAAYHALTTPRLAMVTLLVTLAAAAVRGGTLWRIARLQPKTTLQSALGVRHPRIEQISQGAMGGFFNTREFFHGRPEAFVRRMRAAAWGLGFALPIVVLSAGVRAFPVLAALFVLQLLGLWADRWCFFAEGQHTQNLYTRQLG